MALSKPEITQVYRKRAKRYDLSANLYYLIGFREFAYRKMAVDALQLKPGDTVVEVCCGTGLNFPLLRERVTDTGRIIGVDLTPEMLAQARKRVERAGWTNVELVECDAAQFEFPEETSAVISSFALTLVPEYDRVIQHAAQSLRPGGRMAILDFKKPDHWPMPLIKLAVWLTRPFAVTMDLTERHPWESVDRHMNRVVFSNLYFGAAYLCAGEKQALTESPQA